MGRRVDQNSSHRSRAGQNVDDLCRACKSLRAHTVMAVDGSGAIRRVVCDYCGSHHNYRGGRGRSAAPTAPGRGTVSDAAKQGADRGVFPLVSERERSQPAMSTSEAGQGADLEMLLRRIIREEAGLTPATPSDKWRGGDLVLRPGRDGVQEKSWPIETFFHKVVMLRNRLRVLEQHINGSELPEEQKLKIQGYVTACYGSLTSFNVLFADEADRFKGSGKQD